MTRKQPSSNNAVPPYGEGLRTPAWGAKKQGGVAARRRLSQGLSAISGMEDLSVASGTTDVALYLRVSGAKSAESNLSIPDQELHLRNFSDERNWRVVKVYIEPGVSAKTAFRPQFQRMIADASSNKGSFSKVLIHNTSRFARSMKDFSVFEDKLNEINIELIAVTQPFMKNAAGMIAKRVSVTFDEYHSLRSAEDSMRARRYMVSEGFWPGGKPPDGYRLKQDEMHPRRKVLELDESRRPIIERIYMIACLGDGDGPPLGIKAITLWLNTNGYLTRSGSRWSVQAVHRVLTNPVYYGDYYWGGLSIEK